MSEKEMGAKNSLMMLSWWYTLLILKFYLLLNKVHQLCVAPEWKRNGGQKSSGEVKLVAYPSIIVDLFVPEKVTSSVLPLSKKGGQQSSE